MSSTTTTSSFVVDEFVPLLPTSTTLTAENDNGYRNYNNTRDRHGRRRSAVCTNNRVCKYVRRNSSALLCSPFFYLALLLACVLALMYFGASVDKDGDGGGGVGSSSHYFFDRLSSIAGIHKTTNHNKVQSATTTTKRKLRNNKKEYYFQTDAATADLVTDLPGFSWSTAQEEYLSSLTQYSGYIAANDARQVHYWFIQNQKVTDGISSASDVPVFFWTNGGPGCSGLVGLLSEHGPFWAIDSAGNLKENPYSWHTEVHMVYVEQPYGVGFSEVEDGLSAIAGDAASAADFDAAIRSFLVKFPELVDNEIYLSSESFGGHYVPLTSLEILKNNDAGSEPLINYQGFMLGNPYTNYYENTFGMVEGWYGHGLMSYASYNTWRNTCYDNYLAVENNILCNKVYINTYLEIRDVVDFYALDFTDCASSEFLSTAQPHSKTNKNYMKDEGHLLASRMVSLRMEHMLDKFPSEMKWHSMLMLSQKSSTLNANEKHIHSAFEKRFPKRSELQMYLKSIQNSPTTTTAQKQKQKQKPTQMSSGGGGGFGDDQHQTPNMQKKNKMKQADNMEDNNGKDDQNNNNNKNNRHLLSVDTGYTYYSCAMDYLTAYLNLASVQSALNVDSASTVVWSACNMAINQAWPATDWENAMQKYYTQLTTEYAGRLKMLIYSGDDDSVCGLHGTQYWLERMQGWSASGDTAFQAWEYNKQLGGFLTTYVSTSTGETMLYMHTVHTAGHMVPQTQPGRALGLLKKYLNDLS